MMRLFVLVVVGTACVSAVMYWHASQAPMPALAGDSIPATDADRAPSSNTFSPTVRDLSDTFESVENPQELGSLPRRSVGWPAPLRLAVADSLRHLMPDIERCYRQSRVSDPFLQRIFYLDFQVGPTGRANMARAIEHNFVVQPHSDFHVPLFSEAAAGRFLDCVDRNVDDLQIPSSFVTDGHLSLQYQFILSSDDPPDEI